MQPISFFYFRHKSAPESTSIELFGLGESAAKAFHEDIAIGDVYEFADLKEQDQVSLRRFDKDVPEKLTVREITYEDNLEIKDGIQKIYLE